MEWDVAGRRRARPTAAGIWSTATISRWTDIFVLQHLINRRIPLLKFFIKDQLKWVPIMGLAWWALDFPFMKPPLPRRDYLQEASRDAPARIEEATRKACEKFSLMPTSVMNFARGHAFHRGQARQAAIALSLPAQAQGRRALRWRSMPWASSSTR
jgi:hypothetical protein